MEQKPSKLRLCAAAVAAFFKDIWLVVTVTIVAIILFRSFVATFYEVDGKSMYPTLHGGERLVVVKFLTPDYGDIVVLCPPGEWGKMKQEDIDKLNLLQKAWYHWVPFVDKCKSFIKRVIAKGGDTISITPEGVYRNGQLLTEDYINTPKRRESMAEIRVPEGYYFVLGDNRDNSTDGRRFGVVSADQIQGIAKYIVWRSLALETKSKKNEEKNNRLRTDEL